MPPSPRIRLALAAASFAALLSLGGLAWRRASAEGVPKLEPLYYAGTLAMNNQLVTGVKTIVLTLWTHPTDTNPSARRCTFPTNAAVREGRFRVVLHPDCVAAVQAVPELWIEATVDGVPLGRKKIGAVPFALEAQRSATAATASAASGALKTTIDQLADRKVRALRVIDPRPGCPGPSAVGVDLFALEFTLAKETPVRIAADMIRLTTGRADMALMIDDKEAFIAVTHTASEGWAPAHAEWVGTLAAGPHKVTVRPRAGFSAANIWGCGTHGAITALLFE